MSPHQVCDWHSEWHCGHCEGTGRDCTMGLWAWSFGAVGHSICHPICVLDTHCSCSKAGPQSDCGVLEKKLISFVMIQDIWLRVIASHYIIKGKGTHLMTVSHCFYVIRNRIHKTLPGVTSTPLMAEAAWQAECRGMRKLAALGTSQLLPR